VTIHAGFAGSGHAAQAEPVAAAPRAGRIPGEALLSTFGNSAMCFVNTLAAGFAGGGDAAEAEVLSRLLQERGVSPEALLSVGGDGCSRLAALGALSDSLDFVADAIVRFGDRRHQDNSSMGVCSPLDGKFRDVRNQFLAARIAGLAIGQPGLCGGRHRALRGPPAPGQQQDGVAMSSRMSLPDILAVCCLATAGTKATAWRRQPVANAN